MVDSVKFDPQGAKRIVDTVRGYERDARLGRPEPIRPSTAYMGFWATITEGDSAGFYSWHRMGGDQLGNMTNQPNWGQGILDDDWGWAVEINGSNQVVPPAIVRLEPIILYNYFTFTYFGGVIIGTLTSTLARGTPTAAQSASFTPYIGTLPADKDYEVFDYGFIPSDVSPLPEGMTIQATWHRRGYWVLSAYDCDGVS